MPGAIETLAEALLRADVSASNRMYSRDEVMARTPGKGTSAAVLSGWTVDAEGVSPAENSKLQVMVEGKCCNKVQAPSANSAEKQAASLPSGAHPQKECVVVRGSRNECCLTRKFITQILSV